MATHELKTWPEPFQAVLDGRKTHEVRRADRPFAVGDQLLLREWMPSPPTDDGWARFTGRSLMAIVSYISLGGTWGLPGDLCVMSIHVSWSAP